MTTEVADVADDATAREKRPTKNSGDARFVFVADIANTRHYAFVRPHIGHILGRTVLDAHFYGHVRGDWVAQTLTRRVVADKWSEGRLDWDHKPRLTSSPGVNIATPAATEDGMLVDLGDVTADLQAVADGTPWRGWRFVTDAAEFGAFYSNDSGEAAWELHITVSDAPEQPSELRPDGGGDVETATPTLGWDFIDFGGRSTVQTASRVKVREGAPDVDDPETLPVVFDTGWQPNADPEWDLTNPAPRSATINTTLLSTTVTADVATFEPLDEGAAIEAAGIPAGTTIATYVSATEITISQAAEASASGVAATITRTYVPGAGPHHYWDVQVRDGAGEVSKVSDIAEYGVAAKPNLIIDAPTGVVGDPEVTVLAHLDSGEVEAWQIIATGPNRGDVRATSGVSDNPTISWESPVRNRRGRRVFREKTGGWLRVRVWPVGDWTVAIGQQPYVEQWIQVTFGDGGTIAPTNLTVTQTAAGDPRLKWEWDDTDVPDVFLLQVDDSTVVRVPSDDPDLIVNAGHYTWTDRGEVQPLRPHTLGVRAVTAGARSTAAPLANWTHEVDRMWVLPDDGEPFALRGTLPIDDWVQTDRTATYHPLVGPEVDIIYDHVGFVGTFDGTVDVTNSPDVWAALDAIEDLRESPHRTCRVVWNSRTMRAHIRNPGHSPASNQTPGNLNHHARFSVVQVGD